jgi:hypothetical protein
MSKLPETLVLFATAHGSITVESDQVKTFNVPEGMKITRIMTTRPGVCNITQEEQINRIVLDMIAAFQNITPNEIDTIVASISHSIPNVVQSVETRIKTDTANERFLQQFLRSHIKRPIVKVFTEGQPVINKVLRRSAGEGVDKAYDYKLNIINVPGHPDLFDELMFGRTGPSTALRSYDEYARIVSLARVVSTLQSRGVKHLVLFDFTCSGFDSMVAELSERDERAIRRSALGYGRNSKTKSRKTKRRKTYRKWRRSSRFSPAM